MLSIDTATQLLAGPEGLA